jgi:hypothetical protein
MKLLSLVAISGALLLTACQGDILPNDRIADKTAMVLNVPVGAVAITDRRGDSMETFYTATAAGRRYSCEIAGGSVLSMGMVSSPGCKRM